MGPPRDDTPWRLILFMAVLIPLAVLVALLVAEDPAADAPNDERAAAELPEEQPPADADAQTGDAAPRSAAGRTAAEMVSEGRELFFANGCNVCHGDNGEGGIGPTIARTGFTLEQEIGQYRSPRSAMPAFPADRVSDAQVAAIHAWLQTVPLPDTIVPGEGTP